LTSTGGETPIGHVTFCYDVEAPASTTTTTTSSTTTSTTTTTPAVIVAPTSSVAGEVVEQPTTTVEVLPAVEEREVSAEIAFTGSNTGPLTMFGVSLLGAGFLLVLLDRSGVLRRGLHTR
jgi:hypothetical protein